MKELGLKSVVVPRKRRYVKGECYKKLGNLLEQRLVAAKNNSHIDARLTVDTLKLALERNGIIQSGVSILPKRQLI